MPNWCNNTLEISHEDVKMMRRFVKGWNRGRVLDEFIPVPPELKDGAMTLEKIRERQKKPYNHEYEKELEQLTEQLNLKYFGHKNWWDFCVFEWGTKWDIGFDSAYADYLTPDSARGMVTVTFNSAWSPPIGAYEKLSEMGFAIRAYYYEGGMAYMGTWSDGVDDYIDLNGLSADDIERDYPDLNDAFGIAESMREWEEPEELSEWLKDGIEQKKLLVSE